MKTFLKKLACRFIVEITTIENAKLLYTIASSKFNVKTSRMESTKWTQNEPKPQGTEFCH